MIRVLGGAAHLPVMRTEDRRLRLRVTRRDEPDRAKLIEWVLGIAEARHRAWINGEPDPYGLPLPVGIEPLDLGRRSRCRKISGTVSLPEAPSGSGTMISTTRSDRLRHEGGPS